MGTAFYLAPEAIRNRYGWELKKSDMWTIGMCLLINKIKHRQTNVFYFVCVFACFSRLIFFFFGFCTLVCVCLEMKKKTKNKNKYKK